MELSVIIVNYNVRFLLEQCLYAAQKAISGLNAELIVVDNHSTDESVSYLRPLFPSVRFIANTENLGFAKANNRAVSVCKGEYLLFLNPDTLVPEDALQQCLLYIRQQPRAGALGVRMLDGKGRFLPESKRAFPSPMASFCKLTGLAALFPRSAWFNRYALGNLDEHENHTVPVVAGAFMLIRKELFLQVNGFDEDYFLYGEDIDLSYRIQKAGYNNVYFAETSIIHFKGESSGGKELNRLAYFYKAMLVFVDKHYRSGTAKIFSVFLRFAIALRGLVAAIHKIITPVLLPLTDVVLVWSSLQCVRSFWINGLRGGKDFGVPFIPYALPLFAVLFVLAAAVMGLYDRMYKTSKTLISVAFATVMVLALYSLLPEAVRFSRGVILCGTILGSLVMVLFRQLLLMRSNRFFGQELAGSGQTLILANQKEYDEILVLLEKALSEKKILGRVAPGQNETDIVCSLTDLVELTKQVPVSELIFCVGQVSLQEVVTLMGTLAPMRIRFFFHISGSGGIIGSDTLPAGAKTITKFIDYRIIHTYQKRMKRGVDVFLACLLLLSFPLHLIIHKSGWAVLQNAWTVLAGKKTWVGYASSSKDLPRIRPAVLSHITHTSRFTETVLEKADRLYAKEYDWWPDLLLVFRNYGKLGQAATC